MPTAGVAADGAEKLMYDTAVAGKYTGGQNVWYVKGDASFRMNLSSNANSRFPGSAQYTNATVTETEILEQACDKVAGTAEITPGYGNRTLEIYEKDVQNLTTAVHYCAGIINP